MVDFVCLIITDGASECCHLPFHPEQVLQSFCWLVEEAEGEMSVIVFYKYFFLSSLSHEQATELCLFNRLLVYYQKSSVWARRQCLVAKSGRTFLSYKKCGRGDSIFYLVGRTNCKWHRNVINSTCLHHSCTHFFTRKCCDFLLPTSA